MSEMRSKTTAGGWRGTTVGSVNAQDWPIDGWKLTDVGAGDRPWDSYYSVFECT